MSSPLYSFVVLPVLITLTLGCGGKDVPVPPTEPGTVTVISEGTTPFGDLMLTYELIRLTREDGLATYVQWVHPLAASGPTSVIVQTQPYDALEWTGDPVDEAFADANPRADGLLPDAACPDENDRGIAGAALRPEDAAISAVAHLLNGHGALLVYGRFYACDTVVGEVLDTRAALSFLTTRPDQIDPQRVAITGNSWGGFLALYGAVREPDGVDVSVVVPLNPPASLAHLLTGAGSLQSVFPADKLRFFDAYRYRIEAATGGPPGTGDFSRWDVDDLCAGLVGKHTLLLHDNWDTLVPFASSTELVESCGATSDIAGLWWRRPLPIDYQAVGLDHGLLGREPGYPSVYTLSSTYLYAHANNAAHPIIAYASRAGLVAFMTLVRDDQRTGGDVEHARVRVLEAMTPGTTFVLVDEGAVAPADTLWAEAATTVWGGAWTAESLRVQLETGFPL